MYRPKISNMPLITRIYSDKEGRQFRITIPKNIVELQGYKHKDEFEIELRGKDILLNYRGRQ